MPPIDLKSSSAPCTPSLPAPGVENLTPSFPSAQTDAVDASAQTDAIDVLEAPNRPSSLSFLEPVARVFQRSAAPTAFATDALKSASESTSQYILFQPPSDTIASHGLVFVGGAKVREEAYAPIARALAERGIAVAIVRSPFDLPFLLALPGQRIDAAVRALRQDAPELPLAVGGHSAGGLVATGLLSRGDFANVVLLNARTQSGTPRPEVTGVAVYGEKDGLISAQEREQTALALPSLLTIRIGELDHDFSQGLYGTQQGDPVTNSSPQELVDRVASGIADALRGQRAAAPSVQA